MAALAALARESRLDIFRLLAQAEAEGLPASRSDKQLDLPSATLAFHLKELEKCGPCDGDTQRIYAAVYPTMNALLDYLTENCCQRNPVACSFGTTAQLLQPQPRRVP